MQKEGYEAPPLTDSEIEAFMRLALSRAGAEELITPREIIRDFLTLLNILRDNKTATFESLVKGLTFTKAEPQEQKSEDQDAFAKPKNKISLFDIDI